MKSRMCADKHAPKIKRRIPRVTDDSLEVAAEVIIEQLALEAAPAGNVQEHTAAEAEDVLDQPAGAATVGENSTVDGEPASKKRRGDDDSADN
jgi:hypothetical protein